MHLTHEERKIRREQMAAQCQELFDNGWSRGQAYTKLAMTFGVSTATVSLACKQCKITLPARGLSNGQELHPNTLRILDLLKNTEHTYIEIANIVGCTKQNVQIVHKRFLSLGYELPTRGEILERKHIAKQEEQLLRDREFIKKYTETNNIEESAYAAGLSIIRAKKVLKNHQLNATGLLIDRTMNDKLRMQKITSRWLYIIADFFKGDMSTTMLAEKWKKPQPFISNLLAECRYAGLPVPELPDGRENPRRTVPCKENVCKTCGKQFKTSMKLEDGTRIRGDSRRVHCFDCNPYISKTTNQDESENSNDIGDNDLELP